MVAPDDDAAKTKIINKLKKGEIKLYYMKGCDPCATQLKTLGFDTVKAFEEAMKKAKRTKGYAPGAIESKNAPHDISAYPTWEINRVHTSGVRSIEELSKLIGKKSSKFGDTTTIKSALNQQPQFMGTTTYCSGHKEPGVASFGYTPDTLGNGILDNSVTFPSESMVGAPLPRPYGPRDNISMRGIHGAGSLLPPLPLDTYKIGQFGKKPKKRSVKRKKSKKSKKSIKRKKSKKSVKRKSTVKRKKSIKRKRSIKRKLKFGITTPGTKSWKSQTKPNPGLEWANPGLLKEAQGIKPTNPALLYMPVPDSKKFTIPPDLKINVPMNYSFGQSLVQMEGPNNVAYRKPMDTYQAGANTNNWLDGGKPYLPPKKNLLGVQKTVQNPRAILSSGPNIKVASDAINGGRTYTKKGLKMGSPQRGDGLVRTVNHTDAKTLYQPKPPYMAIGKRKTLSHKFGSNVITLDPTGKITITRP